MDEAGREVARFPGALIQLPLRFRFRPQKYFVSGPKPDGHNSLIICVVHAADVMQQDDGTQDSENIWHRSLLGLFLTVLLLIVGGFGLSMWELRHDQEMMSLSVRP